MGISIKREETERLAREVATRSGESLTDAIHNALDARLKALGKDQRRADLEGWLADVAKRPVYDGRTLQEIEKDLYDEHGQPIG